MRTARNTTTQTNLATPVLAVRPVRLCASSQPSVCSLRVSDDSKARRSKVGG
jgi:hypothetical protein